MASATLSSWVACDIVLLLLSVLQFVVFFWRITYQICIFVTFSFS